LLFTLIIKFPTCGKPPLFSLIFHFMSKGLICGDLGFHRSLLRIGCSFNNFLFESFGGVLYSVLNVRCGVRELLPYSFGSLFNFQTTVLQSQPHEATRPFTKSEKSQPTANSVWSSNLSIRGSVCILSQSHTQNVLS